STSGSGAIAAMVGDIADYYAKKSAVVVSSKSSESIDVKVLNIASAVDFFGLEKALTKLNSVAGTEIKRVQGNEVTLTIHLLASQQAFEQEASSISQLMVFEDPLGGFYEQAVPVQLPVESVEPIQLPIETSADKVASVVEQGAAAEDVQLSVPAQPIN
ncbi:DUF2066 domain-containing protein, partial [Vibrio astriarenae]